MMELGACVRLLEKCHTLGFGTACSRKRPRWHASPRSQAEVIGRPFPWLERVTLIISRVCEHAACLFNVPFFVKHDHQHKGNLWQPPNSSFWLLALSSVVALSLALGLLFTCCDLLCTLDDACLTQVDRLKNIAHFHGCGALRLNAATSAEQTHQRLGVAEGINSELQEQLQRVSAGHQVPHEALQPIIHQGMNLLRCQIETRSRIRLVEPKSLMPDRFGKKTGPS